MSVELIDSIRQLDESSSRLVKTTNRLTAVMLGVTFVGSVIAAVGVFFTIWQVIHR